MLWHAYDGARDTGTMFYVLRCIITLFASVATIIFVLVRSSYALPVAWLAIAFWLGWLIWGQFTNFLLGNSLADPILIYIIFMALLAVIGVRVLKAYLHGADPS